MRDCKCRFVNEQHFLAHQFSTGEEPPQQDNQDLVHEGGIATTDGGGSVEKDGVASVADDGGASVGRDGGASVGEDRGDSGTYLVGDHLDVGH